MRSAMLPPKAAGNANMPPLTIDQLSVGACVHYQPSHYGAKAKNGIVKEIRPDRTDGVWVVYNCAGQWDWYQDYTGCLTNLRDLKLGWHPAPLNNS
jgi:hypothetical protein